MANFWEEAVNKGWIQGDPNYYITGKASDAEITHALQVADAAAKASGEQSIYHFMVAGGYIEGDPNYYANGLAQPEEVVHAGRVAGEGAGAGTTAAGGTDAGGGVTVESNAPAEESVAREGVGSGGQDPATQLTILTGKKMQWYFDRGAGKWYVGYGLASGREMVFEADPDQMDALFGVGMRPTQYDDSLTLSSLTQRSGVTFSGNIAEMEGKGQFESEVARVSALALDEGVLPQWAQQDGAAMDIIFIAQSEGKSTDWVVDQLAKLPSFAQRFPNIDKLKATGNLSYAEAVTGFLEMEAGTRTALIAVGQDPAQVNPQLVGDLLLKGHSLESVTNTVRGMDRLKKFQPALDAFNSILVAQGQNPIGSIKEGLDFVSGKAPSALYDVWEASSIAEAAAQAGLGDIFTAEDAIAIGNETNQTLETATASSKKAAEMLLRLRHEVDVGRFGLNHEDLIDISFGRKPRSGGSEVDIQENVNRAVQAATANLQTKRATPYKSFNSQGTIQAASLGNLRQSS